MTASGSKGRSGAAGTGKSAPGTEDPPARVSASGPVAVRAAAGAPATDEPLPGRFRRGLGARVFDGNGKSWLDCRSPVPHIGHSHPQVAEAIARQAATLSYAPEAGEALMARYLERLLPRLPGDWRALPATGAAEATGLALEIARASTGRSGIISFAGLAQGGAGAPLTSGRIPGHVRLLDLPVVDGGTAARAAAGHPAGHAPGLASGLVSGAGDQLTRQLHRAVLDLEDAGFGVAALVLCPLLSRQGLPALGPGLLAPAFAMVRRAGALVIADESEAGLGRTGGQFWAHQLTGFAPDLLVLGEAMAGGLPVGAVLARPDPLADFLGQTRFALARFGEDGCPGALSANPVGMAAALAVLEVIFAEGLAEAAGQQGRRLLGRLKKLSHPRLAGVRGQGLLLALEMATQTGPDPEGAAQLVAQLETHGVLAGLCVGARHVVRLCPPLCLDEAGADEIAAAAAQAISQLPEH